MLVEMANLILDMRTQKMHECSAIRLLLDTRDDSGRRQEKSLSLQFEGNGLLSEFEIDQVEIKPLVSIAIGVAMLAQDERFAEPILLKRDQGKQLDAEGLQRAIERAKRNGRNGMTIGRTLELSPHFRSPHFGIRWTGKGRTVPKLVPVKGCVVSRNKLYPIPTGYLGVDDEERDS